MATPSMTICVDGGGGRGNGRSYLSRLGPCSYARKGVRRREGEEGYFRAHCQPALNYDITVLGLTAAGQGKGGQHSFLFHPCPRYCVACIPSSPSPPPLSPFYFLLLPKEQERGSPIGPFGCSSRRPFLSQTGSLSFL